MAGARIAAVLAAVAMLLTASSKGSASQTGFSATAVAPNQAQNTQSATGIVNQSPLGGVNSNYQINNSYDHSYGFGPGIYCRTPGIVIGAYGGTTSLNDYAYSSSSGNYGGVIGFHIPIGGDIGSACRQLAQEIAKQRQLDTRLTMIKQCASLKRDGISLDYSLFPEFSTCEGVTLLPAVHPRPGAIPSDRVSSKESK